MNPLQPNEYPAYYQPYIASVSADVRKEFEQQKETFFDFISNIPKEKENYAYAPEKWTVKEVIGHLLDTESNISRRREKANWARKEKRRDTREAWRLNADNDSRPDGSSVSNLSQKPY